MRTLMWFRQDLRLHDNPAWFEACQQSECLPFYCLDDSYASLAPKSAGRWWLHHSLSHLQAQLQAKKSNLLVKKGKTSTHLINLIKKHKIEYVIFNQVYEPATHDYDEALCRAIEKAGAQLKVFHGQVLMDPGRVLNKQKKPYQVYGSFAKAARAALPNHPPLKTPNKLPKLVSGLTAADFDIKSLGLLAGLKPGNHYETWEVGELNALKRVKAFIKKGLSTYAQDRNRPDLQGTSELSPHLNWGELSIRQLWHMIDGKAGAEVYQNELLWREFAYHTLYFQPQLPSEPLRTEFEHFPWANNEQHMRAWREGKTGYPMVDAGMRQLKELGWIHNRVRMIVASFFIKHLRLPWQAGADWFLNRLLDGDLANNSLNWQWVAGTGVETSPFFRIFNPVTQAKDYDPQGDYIRYWVTELAELGAPHIHAPWKAPESVLKDAHVRLGKDYPQPIVDHQEAREKAMQGFGVVKKHKQKSQTQSEA